MAAETSLSLKPMPLTAAEEAAALMTAARADAVRAAAARVAARRNRRRHAVRVALVLAAAGTIVPLAGGNAAAAPIGPTGVVVSQPPPQPPVGPVGPTDIAPPTVFPDPQQPDPVGPTDRVLDPDPDDPTPTPDPDPEPDPGTGTGGGGGGGGGGTGQGSGGGTGGATAPKPTATPAPVADPAGTEPVDLPAAGDVAPAPVDEGFPVLPLAGALTGLALGAGLLLLWLRRRPEADTGW